MKKNHQKRHHKDGDDGGGDDDGVSKSKQHKSNNKTHENTNSLYTNNHMKQDDGNKHENNIKHEDNNKKYKKHNNDKHKDNNNKQANNNQKHKHNNNRDVVNSSLKKQKKDQCFTSLRQETSHSSATYKSQSWTPPFRNELDSAQFKNGHKEADEDGSDDDDAINNQTGISFADLMAYKPHVTRKQTPHKHVHKHTHKGTHTHEAANKKLSQSFQFNLEASTLKDLDPIIQELDLELGQSIQNNTVDQKYTHQQNLGHDNLDQKNLGREKVEDETIGLRRYAQMKVYSGRKKVDLKGQLEWWWNGDDYWMVILVECW